MALPTQYVDRLSRPTRGLAEMAVCWWLNSLRQCRRIKVLPKPRLSTPLSIFDRTRWQLPQGCQRDKPYTPDDGSPANPTTLMYSPCQACRLRSHSGLNKPGISSRSPAWKRVRFVDPAFRRRDGPSSRLQSRKVAVTCVNYAAVELQPLRHCLESFFAIYSIDPSALASKRHLLRRRLRPGRRQIAVLQSVNMLTSWQIYTEAKPQWPGAKALHRIRMLANSMCFRVRNL
jgi:hypothetical protein